MKKALLLVILLAGTYANAQNKGYLEVRCRVLKDRRGLDGAEVKIYKNAGLINKLVTENGGKFTANLDFNNNYLITISYPNHYNKSVEFDTKLADKDKELVYKYPFSMDLVPIVSGTTNSDDFTKPIARVVYNPANAAFEIDEQYTKTAQTNFNKKVEDAQKAADAKNHTVPAVATGTVASNPSNTSPPPVSAAAPPSEKPAPPVVATGAAAPPAAGRGVTGRPKTDSVAIAANKPPSGNTDTKAGEELRKKAIEEEKKRKEEELKAKREAEELAKRNLADKLKQEEALKARLAEEDKAHKQAAAEAAAREQKLAREKAEAEAADKARKEAEEQARKRAAEEAYQARLQAEKTATEQALKTAELKAQQEETLRRQLSMDEQNRIAAVAKAQKEAQEKAQREGEERARREAAERMKSAAQIKPATGNTSKNTAAGNIKSAKMVEETITEKNRSILKTTVSQANGVDLIYQVISYSWGGVFYFKNQLSISQDVYNNEIENLKESLKDKK